MSDLTGAVPDPMVSASYVSAAGETDDIDHAIELSAPRGQGGEHGGHHHGADADRRGNRCCTHTRSYNA